MRGSFRIGTISGISIGLHWSIVLIAVLLTSTLAGTILPATAGGFASAAYLMAALATTGLFLASIVAHELGHSIVAQNHDVSVKGITLFALGGVAALDREPSSPGAAAKIALAGPAVSVAIGVASLVGAAVLGPLGFSTLTVAALGWLGFVNVALAVFNMIPALPLDGGRVVQAALWKRSGDQHKATITAATIGRYIGWALVGFGLWQLTQGAGGLWTAVIGFFVITTARAEQARAQLELARRTAPTGHWIFGRPVSGRGQAEPVIDVDARLVDSRRDGGSAPFEPVIDVDAAHDREVDPSSVR